MKKSKFAMSSMRDNRKYSVVYIIIIFPGLRRISKSCSSMNKRLTAQACNGSDDASTLQSRKMSTDTTEQSLERVLTDTILKLEEIDTDLYRLVGVNFCSPKVSVG